MRSGKGAVMEHWADGRLTLEPGTIARITLAAPDRRKCDFSRNVGALPLICARLAGAAETRVVILAAQGPSFRRAVSPNSRRFMPRPTVRPPTMPRCGPVRRRLAALPMPVIAAVRAPVWAGLWLALHADMIFADRRPASASPPHGWVGLFLGRYGAPCGPVGPARAKDMLFSGPASCGGRCARLGPD